MKIKFIKKIGEGIFNFIDNYNDDRLYLFDYEELKKEYLKIHSLFKNNPEYFDLKDFSKNYAFSFYQKNDLLDHQKDADKMADEIYHYLQKEKSKGNLE